MTYWLYEMIKSEFNVEPVDLWKKSLSTETSRRVYEFATSHKPLPIFSRKKGLWKGRTGSYIEPIIIECIKSYRTDCCEYWLYKFNFCQYFDSRMSKAVLFLLIMLLNDKTRPIYLYLLIIENIQRTNHIRQKLSEEEDYYSCDEEYR
jgi:hypothetical protein